MQFTPLFTQAYAVQKVHNLVAEATRRVKNISPFCTYYLLNLKNFYTHDIETYATDGTYLYINPACVLNENVDQCAWTLIHEVMHVANGHHLRMEKRDPERWNRAIDYKVNRIIQLAGLSLKEPPDMIVDHEGRFDGLSAEQVYMRIAPKQNDSKPDAEPGSKQQLGKGGVVAPKPANAAKLTEQQANDELRKIASANATLTGGNMPSGGAYDAVRDAFIAVTCPLVDWENELENMVSPLVPTGQTYSKMHRGMFANGTNYPGYEWSEGARNIGILVDVSGSIDKVKLAKAGRNIAELVETTQPEKMVVVYCSTRVHHIDTFENGQDFKFNPIGTGGTRMDPGVKEVIAELPDMDTFIMFTDLMLPTDDLKVSPDCQKLIITTFKKELPARCRWQDYKVVEI